VRLNLGACDRKFPGFLSVDIVPPADIVCDLNEPWPWEDSSVDEIVGYDVIEHLADKRHTMNELWRILKPGARATIQTPNAADGDGGFCDPTHQSYWTPSDFEYYTAGDPHRERFDRYYGVTARFKVCNLIGGKIPTMKHARRYGGYVVEMQIVLEAVK
jgi:SAM-dependent methyltransferase